LRLQDLPLPQLVLRESALDHNVALMQRWCDEQGVSLAPHGKTSLAPEIIRRQVAAGAWAMTAATVQQIPVMREGGARMVLLANQVVGAPEIARLDGDVVCLVDSVEGVAALDAGAKEPLRVLLELGGTRAGCRTDEQALAVAEAVAASPRLVLTGVEGFEGTLGADREPATVAAVDAMLDRMRTLAEALDARGLLAETDEIVVSAGGSVFFDRVAERLRPALTRPVRVVVRSGCYVTHDDGLYAGVTPLAALRPALELWARVLSCPEPGLAIAGFGKRDAPYDLGLPVLRDHPGVQVEALNDQHAFLRDAGGELRVGDTIVCGISHPCTAFDKWPELVLAGDDDAVLGTVRTRF
jgi:D-serine deaminase-like pyridoxal phosphate-dependent protein